MKTFYDAWIYLADHPIFQHEFHRCLEVDVFKQPSGNIIVCLECGPLEEVEGANGFTAGTHDVDLDCGAKTFEEAIIELAELVEGKYPISPPPNA